MSRNSRLLKKVFMNERTQQVIENTISRWVSAIEAAAPDVDGLNER
jgi:hypothetical protein